MSHAFRYKAPVQSGLLCQAQGETDSVSATLDFAFVSKSSLRKQLPHPESAHERIHHLGQGLLKADH